MDVNIQIFGDKLISRKILRVGERAMDMAPAFEVTVRQMMGMGATLFDSQGASAGVPWAPVKPATMMRKVAAGFDTRTLHMTLRLRRSLTEAGAPDQVRIITPSAMAFGTSVPYARAHQKGTGSLPRRQPLWFGEMQKRDIVKGLQRWVLLGELDRLG